MSDNLSSLMPEGEERNYTIIVHSLYLASVLFGITSIAGLVLSYLRRGPAPDWAETHYTYAIRTFWIGLLYAVISALLVIVVIGIPMLFAVGIWFIVRSVIGLVKALNNEPIPNPDTWLV
jgi:uncharacterized membrane protein